MVKVLSQSPYILSNLQDRNAVFPGLYKCGLNQKAAAFAAFKILPNELLIPLIHLLHRL